MNTAPIRILLVDDNDDDVLLTTEALRAGKVLNIVAVARDGEEALRYLRREPPFRQVQRPGLVLLDINMPRMNGFEVLEAIKADPGLRSLPVVMLTVSDRDEDVVRSFGAGAISYIRKPVSLAEFHTVIRQFEIYWSLVSRLPTV